MERSARAQEVFGEPRSSSLFLSNLPLLRLRGPVIAPGARVFRNSQEGAFLGVDGGWTTMLPADQDDAHGAWSFGARAGYKWPSGLAIQARYDDLGVRAPPLQPGASILQFATLGARYAVPYYVEPFAEALVGVAFFGDETRIGGAVGVGIALPIDRHLSLDFAVRDYLADVDADGGVRQSLSAHFGVTVIFGGGR